MTRVLLLGVFVGLLGCGYSTREPFPTRYASVAVPVFDNASFERGVEFDLTEAVTKELQSRTPYVLARPGAADTVLDGRIIGLERDMLSRRESGGVPQEIEVVIRVDFQWRDARSGEVILDRQGFEAVGRHIPASPVGEPVEIAVRSAVQRMARDIVTTMRSDWGANPSVASSSGREPR